MWLRLIINRARRCMTVKSMITCFLLSCCLFPVHAQQQIYSWGKNVGGRIGANSGASVATDAAGNLYVTGFFEMTGTFDPGRPATPALFSAGMSDVFLVKYDPAGNYLWGRNMGGAGADVGWAVAVDAAGNAYVTGRFMQSADFNPGGTGGMLYSSGADDVFLARYDSAGNFRWVRGMGGSYTDESFGVAVDTLGHVYVTGQFRETANFNPGGTGGMLTAAGFFVDMFLVQFDTAGNYGWAINAGGSQHDNGFDVAVDGNGHVYVTGFYSGTADFNSGGSGGILTSAGDNDVFLAKYDAGGNCLWANSMGGSSGNDLGYGVAVDGSNVYVTGVFLGTTDFNPGGSGGTLTSAGMGDVFIARFDAASGNFDWAKKAGGSGDDRASGVALDGAGNIYVTGSFLSTDFDPGSGTGIFSSAGGVDAFVAAYDSGGNSLWAGNMGGSDNDWGEAVTADRSGNVYLTGRFIGAGDFDPGPGTTTLTAPPGAFIVKLGCGDTTSAYLSVTACGSYTLNGKTYTADGIYTQILPNANASGCDSTIILDLKFSPPDPPVITVNKYVLGTTQIYTSYQWIKDRVVIPGATDPTYLVTENADYQVSITNDKGCANISAIYTVNNVGIDDLYGIGRQISIYPNPVHTGHVTIKSAPGLNGGTVRFFNLLGQTMDTYANLYGDVFTFDISTYANGIYLAEVTEAGRRARIRLVKSNK